MTWLWTAINWRDHDKDGLLLREQYRSLAKLVQIVYLIAIFSGTGLLIGFVNVAPAQYVVLPSLLLLAVVISRLIYWSRVAQIVDTQPIDIIRRDIRRTTAIGIGLGLGFTLLAIYLMGFAGQFSQSLAVMMVWISGVVVAYCLFALPRTAVGVLLAVAGPLIVHFLASGDPMTMALGAMLSFITGVVAYVLVHQFGTFAEIVRQRATIAAKHEQAERAMRAATQMANTDPLTLLSNRRHFEQILAERAAAARVGGAQFAIGMIDLDGFKPVNDAFGHAVGDVILRQVSRRLSVVLEGRGVIARMGGDEFAIIADHISDHAQALALGAEIRAAFDEAFVIDSVTVRLGCTSGFALSCSEIEDTGWLIVRADMALYRAKRHDRGSIAVFDVDDENAARERGMIEQALREQMSADGFDMLFHPVMNIRTGRVRGFEALVRWTHPVLGPVSPAVFIPIAEQIGIIEPLSEILLRKAATVEATWPSNVNLYFNLSADHLAKPGAGLRIMAILAECRLAPSRLEVEVTETAIMRNTETARATLEQLRAAGISVALDDFGTGYSSLSQIKDLPLDRIKIDKTFIDTICTNQRIASLVRSIVDMCAHLEVDCIAEGIETVDQLEILQRYGCGAGQGYLFARPLPADQLMEFVRKGYEIAA